jgi:aspartate/methionine/tyrosine aminotransferase
MMHTAKRLDGIGEYYFSQKLREIDAMNRSGKQVINLGIGSPDLPPHPDVIGTLMVESQKPNQHAYQSYKGSPVLRSAIAAWYKKWYNVDADPETEILPLIGSKEGIMHICMTYLDAGDIALVPNPGYPTYRSAVTLAGGTVVEYELKKENNWYPDFERLQNTVNSAHKSGQRIRLMFVNYPHMPSGQLPTKKLFEELVKFAIQNKLLICHDNPYSFILNETPLSILSVDGAKEAAVELNSLSKSHNMAGWRVGMLMGAKERIDDVLRFKSNMDSGMFLPVQLAAAKALTLGKEWHQQVNAVYAKRREKVFDLLNTLDCVFDEKQAGMFIWAAVPPGYNDSYQLSDRVLDESAVFITPGGIFGSAGERYIRVSLCNTEEKIMEAGKRIQKTFQERINVIT